MAKIVSSFSGHVSETTTLTRLVLRVLVGLNYSGRLVRKKYRNILLDRLHGAEL